MTDLAGATLRRSCQVAAVLAVALFATIASTSAGECVSAEVPQSILLPDGSTYPAGRLTLCLARDYTPTRAMHEASIDAAPIGLLHSRPGRSEGPSHETPYIMFFRHPDGALELYGYALPGTDHMRTFWFRPPPGTERALGMVRVAQAVTPGFRAAERGLR